MAAGAAGKIPRSKFDPEGNLIRPTRKLPGRLCYHLLSCDFKYWNMAAGQKHPRPIITSTPQDAPQAPYSPFTTAALYFPYMLENVGYLGL